MLFSLSPRLLVLALLLVVWGVAVWGADADAIWIDEWWTTHYVGTAPNNALSGPVAVIERIANNRIHENNPVGYYTVMHLWSRLVGRSDVALRLFSGLCIVLSVALSYQLGRAVGGARVGTLTAFLLGLSAFFLNYSHELRMYALAVVWGVLGLLAYWRFMRSRRTSWIWGGVLMTSAAALLYTHYSNALIIVLLGVFHLFVQPKNKRWWQATGLAIGAVILFSPHLIITLSIFDRVTEAVTTDDLYQSGIWSLADVIRMAIMGFMNEQPLFLIGLVISLISTVRTPLKPRQQQGLFFSGALSLGGLILLLILVKAFQTLFHVRYMLVIWPLMALFTALVLTISTQRLRHSSQTLVLSAFVAAWGITGLFLAFDIHFHGLTYSHPTFHNTLIEPTRWDLIGQTLADEAGANDALVLSVGGDVPWTHTGDAEYYTDGTASRLLMLETKDIDTNAFPDFIHGAGRVWMVRNATQAPTEQYQAMEAALSSAGYTSCGPARHIGGADLSVYSAVPQCCEAPQTFIGQFGDVAALGFIDTRIEGTSIAVWQGWQVTTSAHEAYTVGVYAFDAAGTVVGQRDMTLPSNGYTCVLSEFEASVADPVLKLTVYEWSTGTRLPVAAGDVNQLLTLKAS